MEPAEGRRLARDIQAFAPFGERLAQSLQLAAQAAIPAVVQLGEAIEAFRAATSGAMEALVPSIEIALQDLAEPHGFQSGDVVFIEPGFPRRIHRALVRDAKDLMIKPDLA